MRKDRVKPGWENDNDSLDTVSGPFLDSLRSALEAGLSREQIVAVVAISAQLHRMGNLFDGPSLMERTERLTGVMEEMMALERDRRRASLLEELEEDGDP